MKKPFPKANLQYRWETLPPTGSQLEYADKFFVRSKPEFLWSAPKFHSMSFGESPEVCVLGRSNIGKSSLLNALFGKDVAHSSSKPGRTKMMNAFGIGSSGSDHKNRLVVLDMPGYGKGGQASWGTEIIKYLSKRKQLMRAFLLIDSEHGLKNSDEQILALFRKQNIPHQVVFSKVDKLLFPSAVRMPSDGTLRIRMRELENRMKHAKEVIQPDQEDECAALGEIIACSSAFKVNGYKVGIDLVRHAMLQAAGLALKMPEKKLVETPEIVSWDQIGLSSS
jgi:GTP-binding protein